jgi:hypothetical protein
MSGEIANKIGKLKKTIPFKWRVQSELKGKNLVRMIAYVDARDVAEQLDKIIGPENWTDTFKEVKGSLFCSIGINVDGVWVHKSDCGVASRTEKEKGESSDAFKRAAVKWGINRDAYKVGMLDIQSREFSGKNYPCDSTGKFLKGQALYDHCNGLAKISELENYDIDLDEEYDPDSKFNELLALYDRVKDVIPANEFDNVRNVVDGKVKTSYDKIIKYLKTLE